MWKRGELDIDLMILRKNANYIKPSKKRAKEMILLEGEVGMMGFGVGQRS